MRGLLTFLISFPFASTAMAGMVYTYTDPSGEKVVVTKAFSDEERRSRHLELNEVSFTPTAAPAATATSKAVPLVPATPSIPKASNKTDGSKGTLLGEGWRVVQPISNRSHLPSGYSDSTSDSSNSPSESMDANKKRLIELEKNRLESFRGSQHPAEWNRLVDKKVKQLETTPEQYFYNKSQSQNRYPPYATDPRTGKQYPHVGNGVYIDPHTGRTVPTYSP